ncbi:MAG: hypothetical protein KAR42_09400 [candidate division Zixibacteria bacterium]|nr:hypothetical protein [candidate division Zixibacteria bacterium]
MKKALLIIACFVFFIPMAIAQTLPKVSSIDEYWPEGEKKTYIFKINDTEVGQLEATHTGGGDTFREFTEKLNLDLASIGLGPKLEIENELSIYKSGHFLSLDMSLSANSVVQEVAVLFDSATSTARAIIDDDESNAVERKLDGLRFICDNNMIDQLELALAMHDLVPGESFVVPIFSPQAMYSAEFEFSVQEKTTVRYGPFVDTVWAVMMVRPAQQMLYIDRTHDLVKLVDDRQNLVVEYDRDPFSNRKATQKSSEDWFSNQVKRLPIYGLYLLIAVGWLLFLGRDSYRLGWSYILFVLGAIAYPAIYYTQVPLQQLYAIEIITPILQSNGSILLPGVVPALISGVIQETLKLLPLVLVAFVSRPKAFLLISLGAFVGAGFGFIEACHITGPLFQVRILSNLAVTERVFTILFHTATGAMLGYGLAKRKWWFYWIIAAALHSLVNYFIVFVQIKAISINTLEIIFAVIDLTLLGNMFLLQRKFKRGR